MSTLERPARRPPASALSPGHRVPPSHHPRDRRAVRAVRAADRLIAALAYRYRWVTDDAFIDLRVVAHVHHGLGHGSFRQPPSQVSEQR